jgi:hypothetical protein
MVMPGYRRRSLPGRVESSPAIKASFASDLDLAERRIAAKRDISPPDADHQKPSLRQWSSARPGSARPLGRLRSRRRTPIASSKSSSSIVLETAGWVVLSRCAVFPDAPALAAVIRTWRSWCLGRCPTRFEKFVLKAIPKMLWLHKTIEPMHS